jgi:polyribonucleotide nucleotidyltransferase
MTAKQRLLEFVEYEEKYRTLPRSFHIPSAAFPVILGVKGAVIKELQEKTGAKIELDRDTKKCSLRGRYFLDKLNLHFIFCYSLCILW